MPCTGPHGAHIDRRGHDDPTQIRVGKDGDEFVEIILLAAFKLFRAGFDGLARVDLLLSQIGGCRGNCGYASVIALRQASSACQVAFFFLALQHTPTIFMDTLLSLGFNGLQI